MSALEPQDRGLNFRNVFVHLLIGALSLLAGYAAGYLFLRGIVISDTEWAREVIQNSYLQLLCCLPSLLIISPVPALLPIILNTKLRLPTAVTFTMSGLLGATEGFAIFIPFQWVLILGAAL